jgi:hypothetical protein
MQLGSLGRMITHTAVNIVFSNSTGWYKNDKFNSVVTLSNLAKRDLVVKLHVQMEVNISEAFCYEHQQEMCHSGSANKTPTHSASFALLKHDVTRTCVQHNKKS